MLVYANQLRVQGAGAKRVVFQSIGRWLGKQLGVRLTSDQLTQNGVVLGKRGSVPSTLRIYAALETRPALLSWVLRHQDERRHGLRWIVEIGAKVTADTVEASCVLRTDTQSTIISGRIPATRPRVMRFITESVVDASDADFADTVPGERLKVVGEDDESFVALGYEIAKPDRNGAIVLVSPTREGEYLVDPVRLQNTLIGLAQVVRILPEANTYKMEDMLGKRKSAWGGAVNILSVPSSGGKLRNRLLSADWLRGREREMYCIDVVLAWVTESTNSRRLRDHVRPDSVAMQWARMRFRRRADARRGELQEVSENLEETERLWEEAIQEKVNVEGERDAIQFSLLEAQEELRRREHEVRSMNSQMSALRESSRQVDVGWMMTLLARKAPPTPEECLRITEEMHPSRCVVLASAKASARRSDSFLYGRRLLDLLRRLVTEYRQELMSGGDSEAKRVFGKGVYAAKESEGVMRSPTLQRQRTFDYGNEKVEMFRHLKIGVADDIRKTIRVHFHWDAPRERIVIGYCGPHLPVPSH